MSQRTRIEGRGILFRNLRKDEHEEGWSDFDGDVMVNGRDYWLDAWIDEADLVLSLSLKVERDIMQEHVDGNGRIRRNTVKEQPDHSDFNGDAFVDNTNYWVNAWIKKDRRNIKYLSLTFKPKAPGNHVRSKQKEDFL